jgi:hypothetical protein
MLRTNAYRFVYLKIEYFHTKIFHIQVFSGRLTTNQYNMSHPWFVDPLSV